MPNRVPMTPVRPVCACLGGFRVTGLFASTLASALTAASTPSPDLAVSLMSAWAKLRESKQPEELETEDWKALEKAYMEHLLWRFSYPKTAFNRQSCYALALTILVIVLVLSGIVFSLLQLNYALKHGDLSSLATDIEIETAGRVSMSSSIMGGVVLVVSVAFFALYLKYVFQAHDRVPPHVSLADTDAERVWKQTGETTTPIREARDPESSSLVNHGNTTGGAQRG
jgi:hypothetical protein